MNKITIATNIYKKILEEDIKEIKDKFKSNFELQLQELVLKEVGDDENVRFAIEGIKLKDIINSQVLWEEFYDILSKLKEFSCKTGKKNDIQFWIIDTSNKAAVNIAFVLSENINTRLLMNELKDFLNLSVFLINIEKKEKAILLIGRNSDDNKWRLDVI